MLSFICLTAILVALFPLTDTDIWWHLACSREWVVTWTPVREPVVNVHEYFQAVTGFVYGLGGAPLLVFAKSLLWGLVFWLFLRPCYKTLSWLVTVCFAILLFVFRYQFEIRPVVFSLVFLGLYWNLLEKVFDSAWALKKKMMVSLLVLLVQWLWCKCQGLYILGPLFAFYVLVSRVKCWWRSPWIAFVIAMFLMPLLHAEGLRLFLYPFGLLDRLLGLTESASIFASEIAENRSPFKILLAGESVGTSALVIFMSLAGIAISLRSSFKYRFCLLVVSVLALTAERNFVLFLPVFIYSVVVVTAGVNLWIKRMTAHGRQVVWGFLCAALMFVAGLWCRSLTTYDCSMISYQRVPVLAAQWMSMHPHSGRLFNDDRAGGYLAFINPADSTYIDGRFILKSADFFQQYLNFAENPQEFVTHAQIHNIDRTVLPLRYYARWEKLINSLIQSGRWTCVYNDEYFAVLDRVN